MDRLCKNIADQYDGRNEAINISSASRSATMDIIMSFCFAECIDVLDWKGFRHPLLVSMEESFPLFWIFKHIPITKLMLDFPTWITLILSPRAASFLQVKEVGSLTLDITLPQY